MNTDEQRSQPVSLCCAFVVRSGAAALPQCRLRAHRPPNRLLTTRAGCLGRDVR